MGSGTLSKSLVFLLLVLLLAVPVAAQTVRADRVTLNAGPCVITSGSAAPNGSRVGNVCDTFIQTGTGAIWTKTSGTGTSSGWLATLAGAGTPGTLLKWTGTGVTVGDSIVAEAAGLLTVTGSATITGTGTMNAATITTNASIGGTATIGTEHVTGNSTIDAALAVGGTSTLTGNTTLGGWIGTAGYASQVSGWRITNTGAADVRYLFTDELRAKLFTADQETVLAGSERITKSYSTVAQPFTCPAAGATATLWVFDASTYGDAAVFQTNDWVVIHVLTRASFGPFSIADCVGTVSAYADGTGANAGQQSWTFTRGAGTNSGAMTGGTVVAVNQLVQDMGVSGNGYVEMSAVDGANGVNAPYIQTNTWTAAPVAGNTIRQCRLGNLNGIFGNGSEYGLACGANTSMPLGGYLRLSNLSTEIHNIPLTLYDSATQVLRLDPAGPSIALGNPLPTAYAGSNAGLWAGKDTDGSYKIRIGDPTGNRLTYANGLLSIAGEGSGITNINGGNIQAGTISATAVNVRPIGAALNDDPNMLSSSAWVDVTGIGSVTFPTVTDGMVGANVMRSVAGHSAGPGSHNWPIDPTKSYRLHLWARNQAGATGVLYAGINTWTASTATYVGGVWGVTSAPVPTTWTEFNGPLPLAANAGVFGLVLYLNWGNAGGGYVMPGYMEVQDVRVEEVLPSTLIKDGAITTNKILAGTITGDRIAANTITVANLNASGFGDNLIKNSTFEGTLAGWSMDPVAPSGGSIALGAEGPRGPGDLVLAPTGGGGMLAEYFAVPVTAGQAYRVAFRAAPYAFAGQGLFLRIYESTSTGQVRYVRAGGTLGPGEVGANTSTDPGTFAGFNLAGGWTPFEFTYTPPAGTNWISLSFFNYTCVSGYGSGCQSLGIDAVEMQPQIGPGHIRANSITANQIAASTITAAQIAGGTITAAQIAAGTITTTQIAANTITGGNIAGRTITAGALVANTITSNEIGVRAIVAGNINTGTITANEIASATITGDRIAANTINSNNIQAGSITADRLSVTSLSAISANLGSITAGSLNAVTVTSSTINSPTINAGCTTINANGIALNPGQSNNCNWYKWTNGAGLYHDGGAWMGVSGASFRVDTPGGAGFLIDANFNLNANSTINLNGYVNVAAGKTLTVSNLSGSGNRLVCTNNSGALYTSAANGSC
jgi:hypothetical protein